jgi:hypothetical protein
MVATPRTPLHVAPCGQRNVAVVDPIREPSPAKRWVVPVIWSPMSSPGRPSNGGVVFDTSARFSPLLERKMDENLGSEVLHGSPAVTTWVSVGCQANTEVWDRAAGALIAAEAGACTELPCPENDDLVLAAAPGVFDDLRAVVQFAARVTENENA